jgi:hypothetical protein
VDKPRVAQNRRVAVATGKSEFPWLCVLEEEALMTKLNLILGFVCCCCLIETGNAGMNDRTQKLLETQSLNAPPSSGAPKNSNTPPNINARPNYGPTHGVFEPPAATGRGAATVPPRK